MLGRACVMRLSPDSKTVWAKCVAWLSTYGPNFPHICFAIALELEGIFLWMTICFEVYGPDDSTQMRAIYGLAMAHHGMC